MSLRTELKKPMLRKGFWSSPISGDQNQDLLVSIGSELRLPQPEKEKEGGERKHWLEGFGKTIRLHSTHGKGTRFIQ